MKICFMGTPKIAANVLNNISKKHKISALYTKAPAPKSRGQKLAISKAHEIALNKNIEVFHPKSFKKIENVETFIKQKFDLAIVVAYGLILPKSIFSAPKFGTINLHGSLLPRWRGAAPIERAIEAGDKETGPTIMYIDEGLDTGDIIYQEAFPITNSTTASEVYASMEEVGTKLILKVIDSLKNNLPLTSIKQDDTLANYAKILKKEEGKINFNDNAENIIRKINAFEIFPGTYFEYNNENFKIKKASIVKINNLEVWLNSLNITLKDKIPLSPGYIIQDNKSLYITTKDNLISIDIIQRPGKKPLAIKEFLQGYTFSLGYLP